MINSENYPRKGKIEWIGIRPGKRQPLEQMEDVVLDADQGIRGDHYSGSSGKRHVTLIQAEHIPVIASLTGHDVVDPGLLRRNLVISGINLHSLRDKQIKLGNEAVLEITGDCHPCSRMEENLGKGGWNAMRGMGGITARILKGGAVKIGDTVEFLSMSADS